MRNKILQLRFLSILFLMALLVLGSCKTPGKAGGKKSVQENDPKRTEKYLEATKERLLGNTERAAELFAMLIVEHPDHAPSIYELGRIMMERKQNQDALVLAKQAVKLEPENPYYKLLLAKIYKNMRRFTDEADIYADLVKKDPRNLNYLLDWSQALIYAGDLMGAIEVYDKIENQIGISEDLSLQKEKIYLYLKKRDKAIKEIEKLIAEFPLESKYYGILAELYMEDGQMIKALETYNRILELNPNDPLVHMSLADYYTATGDDNKSFEHLLTGFSSPEMDIDRKVAVLLSYYAAALVDTNKMKQGLQLADSLVSAHPQDPKAFSMRADFLIQDEKPEQARADFRKVISMDSSRYVVWEQLLSIEVELKNYPGLASESARAMQLFPEQALPFLMNGISNRMMKKYEIALNALLMGLNVILDEDPMSAEFYNQIGEVQFHLENFTESFDAFETSIERKKDNVSVINNYCYYLALRGERLTRAMELSSRLMDLAPGVYNYMDTHAWVLYKNEQYAEAKIWIERAIESGGDKSAVIREHYGDILYKLGEKKKALESWKKASSLGKGSEFLEKKINEEKLFE